MRTNIAAEFNLPISQEEIIKKYKSMPVLREGKGKECRRADIFLVESHFPTIYTRSNNGI